jgi:hypothetical protein
LACRVYSRVFSKKISSLIKRLSGYDERERRAYEEPEEVDKEDTSYISKKIGEAIKEFNGGNNYLYSYYRYLDRFQTEPLDWKSLFEFMEYEKTDAKIKNLVQNAGENNG